MFEPLRLDPQLFRQVRVDEQLGTIVWPNGADMDPDVLHGNGLTRFGVDRSQRARTARTSAIS